MAVARNPEVDAVRSAALFGICVVNLPFIAIPLEALFAPPVRPADSAVRYLIEVFFQGKFFVLFSFLFGWGFGVQLAAAARHGRHAWPRYRARLIGLFLIGALHAVFVFAGDILMLYAVLGLGLWTLRDRSPSALMRLAAGGLVTAAVALVALGILIEAAASAPKPLAVGPGYLGGFVDVVAERLAVLPLAMSVVLLFNGPLAFAAFCAGLAAWKTGFFEPGNAQFSRLRARAPLLAAVGIAGSLLSALASHGVLGEGLVALLAYTSLALAGPALAAAYLVLLVEVARSGLLPGAFVAVGRMSLTAYVLQGVVAGLVFYGYGLGLYGAFGSPGVLVAAIGIFATVHVFAVLWLRMAAQGPLEWLLRTFMDRFGKPTRALAG